MRLDRDLFGTPIPAATAPAKSGCRKIGYAARPGTGGKNQRCGNCRHAEKVLHKGERTNKCGLMAHAWTHGPETDISLRAPSCSKYERRPLKPIVINT